MRTRVRGAIAALALAGALSVPAAAQIRPTQSDAPIDIAANGLELLDAQRVQIWQGEVEAVQGTNRLRTDKLEVFHAARPGSAASDRTLGGWGEAERMVAQGSVYFVTPDSIATGNVALYDLVRDTITLNGNVALRQGESVLRGDTLVVDLRSGRTVVQSTARGRGANRVRGVFYPEQGSAPAARPASRPAG